MLLGGAVCGVCFFDLILVVFLVTKSRKLSVTEIAQTVLRVLTGNRCDNKTVETGACEKPTYRGLCNYRYSLNET
jgi:hypothetical protein